MRGLRCIGLNIQGSFLSRLAAGRGNHANRLNLYFLIFHPMTIHGFILLAEAFDYTVTFNVSPDLIPVPAKGWAVVKRKGL